MGKCIGKQQTPPYQSNDLRSIKYRENAKSQEIQIKKELITEMHNFKLEKNAFVTKKKTEISDNYDFIGDLGDGNYGKVIKAQHKNSQQIRAIKKIEKKKLNIHLMNSQNILKEIEVLKLIDHPSIIKLYEFYEDSRYFYLVTEYCEGGELFQKIIDQKQFNEFESANIMKQLFGIIQYLHSQNIVHRDLKPENLLLQSAEPNAKLKIKLIDFGTSQIFKPNEVLFAKLGTPYYIAPEVINKQYTYKCDI